MDYRTRAESPNEALVHAQGELALGEATGVGVFVGVETTSLLDEDLHTFFGSPTDGLPTRGDAHWLVLNGQDNGRARIWLADGVEALEELAVETEGASFLRHWPAGRPTRVAVDLQSFYAVGREPMETVRGEVVRNLSNRPAFLGLAFHDYLGLRDLLHRHRVYSCAIRQTRISVESQHTAPPIMQ